MPVARYAALAALSLVLLVASCGRDNQFRPAPPNTDPLVFDDNFSAGGTFQAFLGSKLDAVAIDATEVFEGSASLRITVPPPNDASGTFAGGALTTGFPRDLSPYDALTFYAKASKAATLNVCGVGNDNTGNSRYMTTVSGLALTTSWEKYTLPIPLPSRLTLEQGLFWFAEGHEGGEGYTIWLDAMRFEDTGVVTNPRPEIAGPSQPISTFVGATVEVPGTQTTFDVAGEDLLVEHFPAYFDFSSSADSVAVPVEGGVQIVGGGTAEITGSLGGLPASGSVSYTAEAAPTVPAPTPQQADADVIALYSDRYVDRVVDSWSATWDSAEETEIDILGDAARAYTNLFFAGILFESEPVDASSMTHFRMDIWLPSGTIFRVKLVDFGPDGVYLGGDDSEHEIALDGSSTPPISTGKWISLDIPLDNFTRLQGRTSLTQLIISSPDIRTVYVDNIYFRR